ncbi:MAG: hypothetical protein IPN95_03840 [Bacteroidetes bacterium]|nr:hypothetical protein [Bacteroidota bacterium]
MKIQSAPRKNSSAQAETENGGKSMAPPQFAFQDQADRGAKVAQKKDAGVVQKQEAAGQCVAPATPVIETTNEAWSHYMNGCGSSVDIGPIAIQTLLDSEAFQAKHQRITGGLTTSLTGNFSVDMTWKVFHIGRTNVDYNVQCNGDQCTVTYTLFVNDGFWDVDYIDETVLGGLGFDAYQPDGMGPNLERFGGTPYRYNTATRSFTFQNPGY